MRFSMLVIEQPRAVAPRDGPHLHRAVHHVKEIFLANMPRDYVLDGSAKVQIYCGPPGDELALSNVLGVTSVFMEDFDGKSYFEKKGVERDRECIALIERVLVPSQRKLGAMPLRSVRRAGPLPRAASSVTR